MLISFAHILLLHIPTIKDDQMLHNKTLGYSQFVSNNDRLVGGVHGTWDDHDYGGNDRGYELNNKEERRDAYLNFLNVPKDSPRYERRGMYSSIEFGQNDNIVKVIFLDTRWHRDKHCIPSVGSHPSIPLGALLACLTRWITAGLNLPSILPSWTSCTNDKKVLGEEQFRWLEEQVNESKASVHIIVSSIQVLTTNPVVESWGHFPTEKGRLLKTLNNVKGLVILSGDVHHAEISSTKSKNDDEEQSTEASNDGAFVEVTSSGLTHSCDEPFYGPLCKPILEAFPTNRLEGGNVKAPELPSYYTSRNFGSFDIDWKSRSYQVQVHDTSGQIVLSTRIKMDTAANKSVSDIHAIPNCINGHLIPVMRDVVSFYIAGFLIFCVWYLFLQDDTLENNNTNRKSGKKTKEA